MRSVDRTSPTALRRMHNSALGWRAADCETYRTSGSRPPNTHSENADRGSRAWTRPHPPIPHPFEVSSEEACRVRSPKMQIWCSLSGRYLEVGPDWPVSRPSGARAGCSAHLPRHGGRAGWQRSEAAGPTRPERRCARMAGVRCISISERVAEQLAEAGPVGPGGCTVIHNGIDLARYRREGVGPWPAQLPQGRRVIGTVGSLTQEKGTEDLLTASRTCWSASSATGRCAARWRRGRRRWGWAMASCSRGWWEDVRPWIAASDVLAMPSRSEGMPLTLGCPIVATEAGGIREVVGEAGMLVPRGDPMRLAAALRGVLDDEPVPAAARRCGARGRVRAGRHGAQDRGGVRGVAGRGAAASSLWRQVPDQ